MSAVTATSTRRRRVILGVGLAVLGLWATALVTLGGQLGGGSDDASSTPPSASVSAEPVAFAAPSKRVVLPIGSEQVDEYPTRYPHTPQGAAAAAVALTRYSASLDFATVSEVLRIYAAPDAAQTADSAAAAAVSAGRARLRLPMAGPAPMDASVFAEPFAVRWSAQDEDKVTVSVLSAVEYRSGATRTRELVAAATVWQWVTAVGDWRVVPGDAGPTPPVAEIGSVEFNEHGWIAVADRRS